MGKNITIKIKNSKRKTLKNKTNNIKQFGNVIDKSSKLNNSTETINMLYHFLQNNMYSPELPQLLKNTIFFSQDKLGKSGAKVGILNNNLVLKYYYLNNKMKYIVDIKKNCIRIYFPFNELIINTIFSNMKLFLTSAKYNIYKEKYANYLIPVKSIGLYQDYSFLISKKVGITHNEEFYTNLNEILLNNYIPLLLKNINNQEVLDAFCQFLSDMFNNYFECIKFLNINLGYINTDIKCQNVFIKKTKSNTNILLKDFITNITPLISDLDKATVEINGLLIMPRPDKIIEKILVKYKNTILSKVYQFRYNCYRNNKLCDRFESYQYDIIIFLYDLYIKFYIEIYLKLNKNNNTKINIEEYYQKFHILNTFVKKTLNINDKEFISFYNRINRNIISKTLSTHNLGLHINSMLYYFCKNL